jgi:hypothetical protein
VFILIENDRQSNKLDTKNSKNDDLFAIRIFFSDIQKKKKKERKQNGRKQARPQSSSAIERKEREREKYCLNLIALSSIYTID